MGKKRSVDKSGGEGDSSKRSRASLKLPKRRIAKGILYIHSTYNNTSISLTDTKGGLVLWSTSGSLGFSGAKKSTPFAASKVAELIAEKGQAIGLREIDIMIKGVGPGRESALRSFSNRGFVINSISDVTPIPHNGTRQRKPRRV